MCSVSLILGMLNLVLLCEVARRIERSRRRALVLDETTNRVVNERLRDLERISGDLLDVMPRYRSPGAKRTTSLD